jgi:four helix bundle protein
MPRKEAFVEVLDHEKLDVYQCAVEAVVAVNRVLLSVPRGNGHLSDQLFRAATSIPLNIAEGSGEVRRLEKARFYRMARRSATESAAVLDLISALQLSPSDSVLEAKRLIARVVAMLVRLAQAVDHERSATGTGTLTRTRTGLTKRQ